jgi:hypothetical protein
MRQHPKKHPIAAKKKPDIIGTKPGLFLTRVTICKLHLGQTADEDNSPNDMIDRKLFYELTKSKSIVFLYAFKIKYLFLLLQVGKLVCVIWGLL